MKKFIKIFSLLLLVGFFSISLVACSSSSGIPNSKSGQILYNGGIVSVVDDNIFYANGYVNSDITSMDEFNAGAEYSYLARLDLNEETQQYSSPENVNKLNSEVLGYENAYSFVLGDFVYYTSPNKHKTSSNEHVFTYVSVFKTRLNGKDTKEIMTTDSFDSEKAQFRAVQFYGQSYFIIYDGTALNVINLANDKKIEISASATSVALPKENDEFDGKLYYTQDKENEFGQSGNEVFEFDLASKQSRSISSTINNTITFTGREGNELFLTRLNEITGVSNTYKLNTQKLATTSFLSALEKPFYSAQIDNIFRIECKTASSFNGYIFESSLSGEAQLFYKADNSSEPIRLLASGEYVSVLFVNNDLVFFSTEDGISYLSVLKPEETKVLVDGMTIISDKVGYEIFESGNLKNVYFYAQRVYDQSEDAQTSTEDQTDTNYYLYQVSFATQTNPKLLGKTIN